MSEASSAVKEVSINRSAGVVGLFTLLSRIFGFLRDMLTASYLGAGLYSDAFFVAFRLPNLFRRLFGEGSLTVAFVPIFTRVLHEKGKEAAHAFTRSAFSILFLILVGLILLTTLFAEQVAWLFASGFSAEKLRVTTQLTRIVFPYILLVSLVALTMGVLNSLKHFSTPAASPLLLNLGMIFGLLVSPWLPWNTVYSLAMGVILGGLMQVAMQAFTMARYQYHLQFSWVSPGSEVRELARNMLPAIFGTAAYQINLLINTQLASHLSEGSVSYLYYSDRLIEFPLGMVAVSLGTAILPYVSKQVALADFDGVKRSLQGGLKSLYFLMLPAMVGLMLLKLPICDLLYHRNAFGLEDAKMTAYAMMFSTLGLLGVGTLRVTAPIFYAMKDMWTPLWVSLTCIAINLTAALLLMPHLNIGGLALAVSISATANALILQYKLRRKIGRLGMRAILNSVIKMSVAATVMGGFIWLCQQNLNLMLAGQSRMYALTKLFMVISAGGGVYLVMSRLLKIEEANQLITYLRKRLSK